MIKGVFQGLIFLPFIFLYDPLKKPNMLLFFDTETTGIPRNWKAPVSDTKNWSRMIQLAWLLFDNEGNLIDQSNRVIKPDGYVIPVEFSRIHGIRTERAIREGEVSKGRCC